MDSFLILFLALGFHGFSLAAQYCPKCHTREGWLDCHPEDHHICHENEVCQIHAHEDPHGVAMETDCRPAQDCYRDSYHEEVACAAGRIPPGPHGCFWCCTEEHCMNQYLYLLFPNQFTTKTPIAATTPTPAPTMAPTPPPLTKPPLVITSNCHVCEDASDVSACLSNPHNCSFTEEVCMMTFDKGKLSSSCRSDQYCTEYVRIHNNPSCYEGFLGDTDVCGFCCEVPGCLENVVIPKLPSSQTPAPTQAPVVTTQAPVTAGPTTAPTTKYPLGPDGEINCHVCEEARNLEDCLRHPTYCHEDRGEICMIEYDPMGHVHARCEKDRHACLDKAQHNSPVCVNGQHGHPEHCTYCCDTLACFQASVGGYLPTLAPTSTPTFNCHVCDAAEHLDDCLRHPTYCDHGRNEICMVEYDPRGHVHSRCEPDRRRCEDRQQHNHQNCSSYGAQVKVPGPPGPPGPGDHEPCVYCCETTDCLHQSVGGVIIG